MGSKNGFTAEACARSHKGERKREREKVVLIAKLETKAGSIVKKLRRSILWPTKRLLQK
jgi:hypothetical protein